MLADFCNELWDTRIDSDTLSSDGFEVSNLISRDAQKKQRGFLAARFVKPPVALLISFPFPIDVYAVNVNPQVGGQRTSGLEISAACLKYSWNFNDMKPSEDEGTRPKGFSCESRDRVQSFVFHSYEDELDINNLRQKFHPLFQQILRVRMVEGKVGHFPNPCFGDISDSYCSKVVPSAADNVHKCNLQQCHRLQSTSHVCLKITQVHKGSVPCLGAVEVIGRPARNSCSFVMNYANLITLRLNPEQRLFSNGFFDSSNQSKLMKENTGNKHNLSTEKCPITDDIPHDFIDPITFQIMTLPVLLPSGTTIDQSTLEKHIAAEKNWGRQPSDPFTGLALTSKLVPNVALKYRIDNFLLSSEIDVSMLGRSLGPECKSSLVLKFDALKHNQSKTFSANKRKNVLKTTDGCESPGKKPKTDHSQRLSLKSDSLDEALEQVLSVQQKSMNTLKVTKSSLVQGHCLNQNEPDSKLPERRSNIESTCSASGCSHHEKTPVVFLLPCQRVLCRNCLACAVDNKCCPNCQRDFEQKDVVRVHLNRISAIQVTNEEK